MDIPVVFGPLQRRVKFPFRMRLRASANTVHGHADGKETWHGRRFLSLKARENKLAIRLPHNYFGDYRIHNVRNQRIVNCYRYY